MVEYSDFPGTLGKPLPNQTDLFKSYAALVTERYKYVEYADGFRELYDLQTDPYELENQVASADQALVDKLSAWLHAMEDCAGKVCRQVEEQAP
jgi:arylsulfatase A-like enzyme